MDGSQIDIWIDSLNGTSGIPIKPYVDNASFFGPWLKRNVNRRFLKSYPEVQTSDSSERHPGWGSPVFKSPGDEIETAMVFHGLKNDIQRRLVKGCRLPPYKLTICPYLNKPLQKETIVFKSCIFRRWRRLFPPSRHSRASWHSQDGDRAWCHHVCFRCHPPFSGECVGWTQGRGAASAVQVGSHDEDVQSPFWWAASVWWSMEIGVGNLRTPDCGLARLKPEELEALEPLGRIRRGTCPLEPWKSTASVEQQLLTLREQKAIGTKTMCPWIRVCKKAFKRMYTTQFFEYVFASYTCLGGGFKYCLFSPLFGEDSHFD